MAIVNGTPTMVNLPLPATRYLLPASHYPPLVIFGDVPVSATMDKINGLKAAYVNLISAKIFKNGSTIGLHLGL